jgi:hypothetical protein
MGNILRNHPVLKGLKSLQEYPIPHTTYHVDWFLPDLLIAIELHGEQHYKPVCFGGITMEEAQLKLQDQKKRDLKKKNLCLANGWKYIEFSYDEPMDFQSVGDKIIQAIG